MKFTKVFAIHDYFATLQKDGKQKYKYIIHSGSSRSSKTISIIQWLNEYCLNNPKSRVTVWRDTKESLKHTVWSDFRKFYSKDHNFTKHTTPIFYDNGSTFEPHGADSTNAHGLTQNIAWLNEPYKVTKETFDQIDQRADLIIIDLNPKQGHWSDDLMKNERAVTIHSTYKDNPFCPYEQRLKIESYEPYESGSYEVIGGELFYNDKPITETNQPPPHKENISNGTADLYMWQVYGLGLKSEKPNKIYTGWQFKEFDFDAIPSKEWYGLDFGSASPSALVRAKWHDNTLFVDEVHYGPVSEFNDLSLDQKQGYSYLLNYYNVPKGSVVVCDSAKPVLIAMLRRSGYTLASGAMKPKGSVEHGISLLQMAKAVVTKRSINIENEYDSYEWALDRYGLTIDQPIKSKDHTMDAIRYLFTQMATSLQLNL